MSTNYYVGPVAGVGGPECLFSEKPIVVVFRLSISVVTSGINPVRSFDTIREAVEFCRKAGRRFTICAFAAGEWKPVFLVAATS